MEILIALVVVVALVVSIETLPEVKLNDEE